MAFYKKNQVNKSLQTKSPYTQQLIQIAKLANYEPTPSIMPTNNAFNFTLLDNGQVRRKIKDQLQQEPPLQIPRSHDRARKPYSPPQTRLHKMSSKINRIQHHPTNTSENPQQFTFETHIQTEENPHELIIGKYLPSDYKQPNAIFNSIVNNNCQSQEENHKIKLSKRYNNNYSSVNKNDNYRLSNYAEQTVQEDSQEYDDDANPGPGYYSVNTSTFQSNNSGMSSNFSTGNYSFGSKANRFRKNSQKQKPIMDTRIFNLQRKQKLKEQRIQKKKLYQQSKSPTQKKIIPFLSGSVKSDTLDQLLLLNSVKNPSPQDYRPRYGIEQDLIKKIQRNFKGNFGVIQQRFKVSKSGYDSLGPGEYNVGNQNSKGNVEHNTDGSYYFMSNKKRFE